MPRGRRSVIKILRERIPVMRLWNSGLCASTFLGIRLARRVPTGLFYKLAYVIVFVISLQLVHSGAMATLRG